MDRNTRVKRLLRYIRSPGPTYPDDESNVVCTIDPKIDVTRLRKRITSAEAFHPELESKLGRLFRIKLYEYLDSTTATCLGLTCKEQYNIYCQVYPDRVEMTRQYLDPFPVECLLLDWKEKYSVYCKTRTTLAFLLKDFMLGTNCLYHKILGLYLDINVYGEEGSKKLDELVKRYLESVQFYHDTVCFVHYPKRRFPNPMKMSEDQYRVALRGFQMDDRRKELRDKYCRLRDQGRFVLVPDIRAPTIDMKCHTIRPNTTSNV